MKLWQKIALGIVALIVVVAVGLMVWEPLAAAAPTADPKVAHDARIRRDDFGVPHIDGKTDADVAYGLAYAEAEDDFATIEELLAAIRGRSAAISGAEGAKIDYVGALIDAQGQGARGYTTLSPATRALVEAYAAGLNRYADTHSSEVRLSRLFPVTGRDVVAGFALRSPFFFGLDRTLGALAEDKLPPRDGSPASERGSNAFAVAASRSTDATTRLISNSHQPWTGGVAWYEVVLHSDAGWHFAGALFPGAPFGLVGHNETLGWTNTVNRGDLIDTYKLVLDGDGTHYRYDGAWLPLETHRVWLHVKVGPFVLPVPKTIARSRQGPVVGEQARQLRRPLRRLRRRPPGRAILPAQQGAHPRRVAVRPWRCRRSRRPTSSTPTPPGTSPISTTSASPTAPPASTGAASCPATPRATSGPATNRSAPTRPTSTRRAAGWRIRTTRRSSPPAAATTSTRAASRRCSASRRT